MKRILPVIYFTVLSVCCSTIMKAQEPHLDWVKGFAPTAPTLFYGASVFTFSSVTDDDGNVYITGQFVGDADFDPGPDSFILSNQGSSPTAYVSKLNAKGEFQWAKQIENRGTPTLVGGIPLYTSGSSYGYSIAIDKAANIYIAGYFMDTMDFDPGPGEFIMRNTLPIVPSIRSDGYLLKLDSSGSFIWAKQLTGASHEVINQIIVDKNDNLFIVGTFSDSMDIDFSANSYILHSAPTNYSLTSPHTAYSAFVAKYDTAGALIWGKKFGSDSMTSIPERNYAHAFSVAVDTAGAVYIYGIFRGNIDFDPSSTSIHNLASKSSTMMDIYLCKLQSDGTFEWVNGFGTAWDDRVPHNYSLSTFGNDVYFISTFRGTVDFDPGTSVSNLTSLGARDIVVAKYGSDGSYKWAKALGGKGEDLGRAITINSAGVIHITGNYRDTVDFDPGNSTHILISPGTYTDVFLSQWDTDANLIWAGGIQGNFQEESYAIHLDRSNNIFTTGMYSSTVSDFDPNAGVHDMPHPFVFPGTTSTYGHSGFIHKLSCGITDSVSVSETICEAQYTYNGQTYNTSGTYTHIFPKSATGCDSIITLTLTFYQLEPVITINGFVLGVNGTYATYQWYKDGELIAGATNSTYTVTENGDYTVKVTNEEGCEATSPVYEVTNAENSVNEISNIGEYISIYPNPAQNVIYINSPVPIHADISSIDGRKILYAGNAKEISVKELAQGIYLLHITDKDGRLIKVEKLVKK